MIEQVDRFDAHMENTVGVQSILSLPWAAKQVSSAFSEAAPKFRVLPRNQYAIVQAITPIPTSSGLLNPDCSALAVFVFTKDHTAATRSEEHTSELQSLMRISYAVFCLKKKNKTTNI